MKKLKVEVEFPDEIQSLLLGILKVIDEPDDMVDDLDYDIILLGKKIISDLGAKFEISITKNENN